jgi:hypothetical protein
MASKALTEDLRVRVSKPMLMELDGLAKAHGVKTARLVRAALWIFLNASGYAKDENGDVLVVTNRQGKSVPKELPLWRHTRSFAPQDEELAEMLRFVDTFDAGGTTHDMSDRGPFLEDEDDGDPVG